MARARWLPSHCIVALLAISLWGCATPRAKTAAPLPINGHHPLLHLLNPESVDLTIYDDGEVSGTDLRVGRRARIKFGQLSTALADALRAGSVRVPDSLRLVAISSEAKTVCAGGQTILYGVFNSAGQEVVFRKSQNCREYIARPRDGKLGATLYRYSEILRGWELTVSSPD